MNQEQPTQLTAAQSKFGCGLNRDDLAVIIEALEYRCEAIEAGTDFDETARLKGIGATLTKLRALEAQPQRPEHERYERLLRATAALRYPESERTPELQARIEKTTARKVGDFLQEQQHRERVKLYENSLRRQLAEKHPNLTPAERQHYEQRIAKMVEEYRQNQAPPQQQQQQAQVQPAHSQQQERGMKVER